MNLYLKMKDLKILNFLQVDVDDNDELCKKYEINCMPTFILLKIKKN